MNEKKTELPKLKMKLSLKKETLRTLTESELPLLDGVVGGTGCAPTSLGCIKSQSQQ